MITVPQLLAPVDPEAPLLVVATREEAEHLGVDVPVLLTGIGRINATAALAETLARGPLPATILNVGTAGSLYDGPAEHASGPSLAGVHRISRVILHDFSHSAVRRLAGADAYPAIDLGAAGEGADETSSSKILATGDLFVEDSATRARLAETADLVDMEGLRHRVGGTAVRGARGADQACVRSGRRIRRQALVGGRGGMLEGAGGAPGAAAEGAVSRR